MLTDVVLPLKPWTVATALLIHCCLAVGKTPNYCARFEFPDLPDMTLTAPEGSLVNVSFRLVFNTSPYSTTPTPTNNNNNNDDDGEVSCLERQNIVMGVSKGSSSHPQHDCFLRVNTTDGDLCQSFNKFRCHCTVRSGVAVGRGDAAGASAGGGGGGRTLQLTLQLTKRVGKGDEGWWRWWTRDDVAPPASVFLGVSDKEPENKEENQNRLSSSSSSSISTREVTEPQHPSTISPGINLDKAENVTSPTTNHSSSNNSKNPNAEVEEGEKNKIDDGDDNDDDTKTAAADASAMNVSYVGAIVAGVNIATVIIIGIIVFIARRVCCKHGRQRGEEPPRPCSMNAILTEQRRRTMSSSREYSKPGYEKRVYTSSWIYDEIPDDATKTLITAESSLYLHPIECTTITTTPATPTITTASAVTSTTITFSK